jgi:uncharacterized protein
MYFPTADLELNPLIPPLVAFVISFFTSMGGVSGAFLILPFQMSVLGFTSPAVSATNQLYNIVAIPSGVYRYVREGRMVWPLTWIVAVGTVPGVVAGALIRIRYLPDPRDFKLFAGLVLLYLGARLLADLLAKKRPPVSVDVGDSTVAIEVCSPWRLVYAFQGRSFSVNVPAVVALSLVVGVVGGVYGIGGGAIMAPVFVAIWRLPVYTIAGAALMGTFITSVVAVAFYQIIAPHYPDQAVSPDWLLGVLFGVGGFAGMYCGARLQKRVPAGAIKWLLAGCILFTAARYIIGFFY